MSKQQKAFTLVELIVVITILAILGTIAFISLQGYSAQSRDGVRITDVSSMKTALELFHLDAGKYPISENFEEITFSGEILWYQGLFGVNTLKNVENLDKVPLDPLSDKQYIYSVSGNKNNFEILNLLEGDLVLNNTLIQTNAANSTRTAKVNGVFNGLYVKTTNYIVPVPSLLTSEDTTGGMILDSSNIKSQIISGGKNIPSIGNVISNTGGLDINLSVYTGSINKKSTDQEKIDAMTAIQGAYTGSSLATSGVYKDILSKTSTGELLSIAETTILGTTGKVDSSVGIVEETVSNFPDSVLLTSEQSNTIAGWYGNTNKVWTLCYRASTHGTAASTFHANCDNIGPTISVYKFGGNLVGGYGSSSWDANLWNIDNGYIGNTTSWLFNLSTSTKLVVNTNTQYAQRTYNTHMSTFGGGHDLICGNSLSGCSASEYSYVPNPVVGYVSTTADDLEVWY